MEAELGPISKLGNQTGPLAHRPAEYDGKDNKRYNYCHIRERNKRKRNPIEPGFRRGRFIPRRFPKVSQQERDFTRRNFVLMMLLNVKKAFSKYIYIYSIEK